MARSLEQIAALFRVALMNTLAYRSSFLLQFFVGGLSALGTIFPLLIVYEHAPVVAGWALPEALLVTSFFLLLTGLIGMFVEPNLGAVVDGVRSGSMDFLLTKPMDAQLLASIQRVDPARGWEILTGLGLGGYALSQLPMPSPLAFGTAAGLFVAGLAAMYSVWITVVCLSFFFVRIDNLRFLLSTATDAGRWPISVYRGWARLLLTVVLPVALVTSWPAMALTGRMEPALVGQAGAVALGGLGVSRALWVWALRRYSSASS